jgi:PAC2 family
MAGGSAPLGFFKAKQRRLRTRKHQSVCFQHERSRRTQRHRGGEARPAVRALLAPAGTLTRADRLGASPCWTVLEPLSTTRCQLGTSSYEGPTGIVGVLHTACANAGLPSASVWASVPHYVAAASNPKAALALLRKIEGLIGVSVDVSELESSAADYERQVGLAVRSDPDIQAFVERLEQAADSEEQSSPEDLPSGDILASEFQRFLRQRGRDAK